jgi:hypothetical protein
VFRSNARRSSLSSGTSSARAAVSRDFSGRRALSRKMHRTPEDLLIRAPVTVNPIRPSAPARFRRDRRPSGLEAPGVSVMCPGRKAEHVPRRPSPRGS